MNEALAVINGIAAAACLAVLIDKFITGERSGVALTFVLLVVNAAFMIFNLSQI